MAWAVRHPVFAGMAGGLGWGVLMRAWMRLISTDPEFSWSGTGFILGASTIVGTLLGIAWLRRRQLGRGWYRLLGCSIVLVGAGAGAVMLPSVLGGALALGRTSWARWVRLAIGVVAISLQVPVFVSEPVPGIRGLLAYPWYAVMITVEAWALSVAFRPSLAGAPAPRLVQRAAVGLGLVALAGLMVLTVGVRS